MRADSQCAFFGCKEGDAGFLVASGMQADTNRQMAQPFREITMMLLGENLSGCHQERIIAALQGAEDGKTGDHSLARTHITLQQTAHGVFAGKVRFDLHGHRALRVGKLEADGFKKWLRVGAVTAAG